MSNVKETTVTERIMAAIGGTVIVQRTFTTQLSKRKTERATA